jgi:hypothetical protein
MMGEFYPIDRELLPLAGGTPAMPQPRGSGATRRRRRRRRGRPGQS